MSFGTAELETFVKDLGLPAEKAKIVMDAIGSDAATLEKFGGHVLRQSDYSAKMGDLQKQKDALEADYQKKVNDEQNFHSSLVSWKSEKEKEAEGIIAKAKEEAQGKLTAVQQKIRELAERNGIPESEIKDMVDANIAPVRASDGNADPLRGLDGRFVSVKEFADTARYYAKLPAIQMSLEREYFRLFGDDAPEPNWDKLIDDTQRVNESRAAGQKLSLAQMFEQTYKLPEKRAEVATKRRQEEIDKARKEGEEAALVKFRAEHPDLSTRTVDRERRGSPILEQARTHAAEGKRPNAEHGSHAAVSAAVAAFNSGKYKEGHAA